MDMRRLIEKKVASFVKEFQNRANIQTEFGEPIVGVADAFAPEIQGLRQVIGESHVLPQQVMADAKAVLAYYVPFTEELAMTNRAGGSEGTASPEWARAYEELNMLFGELNVELVKLIKEQGADAAIPGAAMEFDQQELVSNWSHRHMAYAAGLGTFGINNMLITRKGCCGRFNSIVTNLELDFDEPMKEEMCLYKVDESCGVCLRNCPAGALHPEVMGQPEAEDKFGAGFARAKCYEVCLENADRYPIPQDLAPSYSVAGSEVCGKCVTGSPCAFWEK